MASAVTVTKIEQDNGPGSGSNVVVSFLIRSPQLQTELVLTVGNTGDATENVAAATQKLHEFAKGIVEATEAPVRFG